MNRGDLLYEGKAKRLYAVPEDNTLIYQEFKNSLTAFNGVKKGELAGKGEMNRKISSLIFRFLEKKGIRTHWVKDDGNVGMITRKVKIIPLEVVVRNRIAGSLAKKLNREEGDVLSRPIVDFHLKDDALGDPFLSDDQAVVVCEAASDKELSELKQTALKINKELQQLFEAGGLSLVDFKLEFGKLPNGTIVLADEISPDSCRLWDLKTGEKRDKDRFRRDLGNVLENYQIVLSGLEKNLGGVL